MNCACERLIHIFAKHNDVAGMSVEHLNLESNDYMKYIGPFGGDDFSIDVCLDCGKIQDWDPVTDEEVKKAFKGDDADEEEDDSIEPRNEPPDGAEPETFGTVHVRKQFYEQMLRSEFGDDFMKNQAAREMLEEARPTLAALDQRAVDLMLRGIL